MYQQQFINKKTGEIIFIDKDSREYKKYSMSKEWEQAWNLYDNGNSVNGIW